MRSWRPYWPVSQTIPQLRREECSIGNAEVRLSPLQTELLAILLAGDPDRPMPKWDLIDGLWPNPDIMPEDPDANLKVHIYDLRRLGVLVECRPKFGYRIPIEGRRP